LTSEWRDSHRNPKGNFRKLLQERINANRIKRETLTNDKQHRLSKLADILCMLEEGECAQIESE